MDEYYIRTEMREYYIQHRTAGEHNVSTSEWKMIGPFTLEEAKVKWEIIRKDWQEGGIGTICKCCDTFLTWKG